MTEPNETAEPSGASGGSLKPECAIYQRDAKDGADFVYECEINGKNWSIPCNFVFSKAINKGLRRTWLEWLNGEPKKWSVTYEFDVVHVRDGK